MTPYVVIFAVFLLLYVAVELTSAGKRIGVAQCWLLLLPLTIFALIYAGHIGTDAEHYGEIFDVSDDVQIEPGFALLMTGARKIGLDYIGFTKVLALVQMLLLAYIVKKLRDPLFFLLFYFAAFFLMFQFNAIRNSLAALIAAAVYVRLGRPSVAALISSIGIHYSSVILLGLQRLAISKRQWLAIGSFAAASLLFSAIWLRPGLVGDQLSILLVYQGYLGQDYTAKAIYPALLVRLVVVWLLYRSGGSYFYLVTYAILVLVCHVVTPIVSRMSDIVLFLALLDFCLRQRLQRYRAIAIALTMAIVASSFLIPWSDCQTGGADNWCLSGPGR